MLSRLPPTANDYGGRRRRAALIPDSATLSPTEAEDVQRRQSGISQTITVNTNSEQPLLHDPFQSTTGCISDNSTKDEVLWPPSTRSKPLSRHQSSNDKLWLQSRDCRAGNRSSRQAGVGKAQRACGRECRAFLEPAQLRLDNKRSHATYSEDERRHYSIDVSENIPHMSEIGKENSLESMEFDYTVGHSRYRTTSHVGELLTQT